MRKAQTVRHRYSQSVAVADDLGVMGIGNQNIEDVLRQDLAATRRENERLQTQVDALSAALKARPSIERVQELEREFQSLELLLHGTQKENERAMTELERIKAREKVMERELRKYAGEDWEECLNIGGNIPNTRSFGGTSARLFLGDTATSSNAKAEGSSTASNEATLAHMEQIRAMLMGMSERLQNGEEKLQQAIERAERENSNLDDMLKEQINSSAD